MRFLFVTILIVFLSTYSIAKDIDLHIHEKRVALVIGNSKYQRPFSRLSNTINDAQAIKNILSNRGFEVIYKENISFQEFDKVLDKFYKKLRDKGVGLLYFSGHGIEVNGKNYLIPTDANMKNKKKIDVKYQAISLNQITDRLQEVGNRLNIVILDACRNDPFSRAYGVGGLGKTEPIGLFIAYATGAGQVSSDGRVGGHGLFTQYLIENMKKPSNLQKVFRDTRTSVYEKSEQTQFPAIYDQTIKGDFYFTLPNDNLTPTPIIEPLSEYTPTFKVYAKSDINRQKTINASIFIKNQGVWKSGMKFEKGKYHLTISAKNYKTQSYPITIESNKGFDFQLPLIVKKIKPSSYKSNAKLIKQGKLIPHPTSEREVRHNAKVRYDNRFSKKSINTVLDHKTGLVWPKLIQQNDMNLSDAKKYCSNFSLDGYNDWRLPTIEELQSVTNPLAIGVVIPNPKYFNYKTKLLLLGDLKFWSSTKVKERDEYIPGFGFRTFYNPPYSKVSSFNFGLPPTTSEDSMLNNALCVFLGNKITRKEILLQRLDAINSSVFDEDLAKKQIAELLEHADASVSY